LIQLVVMLEYIIDKNIRKHLVGWSSTYLHRLRTHLTKIKWGS
jgi:hypothetical protein